MPMSVNGVILEARILTLQMRGGPKFEVGKLIDMKLYVHVSGRQRLKVTWIIQHKRICFLLQSVTCYLLAFPSHCPSDVFYYKPLTILINNPWIACHGCWVELSWLQRITALDTFKHRLSVWYITRGIRSYLWSSVIQYLWLTLTRHLIDISINTQ